MKIRSEAKLAVERLNQFEIRPNKFLGVIFSVDNRKLWISGIPKNRSAAEIRAEMSLLTEGVRNVILYPSQTDKSRTRGYAFVEYESHRAAALARRKLVPGRVFLFNQVKKYPNFIFIQCLTFKKEENLQKLRFCITN